jgi:hypothetical protein
MAPQISFDREIGERLKDGFYLKTPEEDIGQFTDSLELKYPVRKQISFVRIVDEVVQNGIYFKSKEDGHKHYWNLFRSEQTGLLADREIFVEVPFEKGDILRITITPFGRNMVTIQLEILSQSNAVPTKYR